MKISTLIKVLLITAILWAMLFGGGALDAFTVLESASEYQETVFEVEDVDCHFESRTSQRALYEYRNERPISCSLEGTVDGNKASLGVSGAPKPLPLSRDIILHHYPPGHRIPVLYNPKASTSAVQWWTEDLEGDQRYALSGVVSLVLMSLGSIIALFLVVSLGARWRSRSQEDSVEIEQDLLSNGWGLGIGAFGLTLLISLGSGYSSGSLIVGAILFLLGSGLLARRWVRVMKDGNVSRGFHLYGFPMAFEKASVTAPFVVTLDGEPPPDLVLNSTRKKRAPTVLLSSANTDEVLHEGERVANLLGVPLERPSWLL